jgi:ABC-type multidrug transport system ATPase subunit
VLFAGGTVYNNGLLRAIRDVFNLGADEPPLSGDIVFERVTSRYRDVDVLKDVSVSIPQGKVSALVGSSGSGKTTLTRIAARFGDVSAGKVTMGGRDYTVSSKPTSAFIVNSVLIRIGTKILETQEIFASVTAVPKKRL